jgi:serine/threonine protein kinase
LYEQILRLQSFSEAETREIIKSSLEALAYLHKRGVIHRDVKPENLLICPKSKSLVKLADFGFATHCKPGEKVSGSCGSPSYVAPDILHQRPYDGNCDLWSLGIIMFLLCFGELPFYSPDAKEQFHLIKT